MIRLLGIVAVCALVVWAALGVALVTSAGAASCHEDEPCWVWSRMGNHSRGITLVSGRAVTVGPCRYARLRAAGHIHTSTPALRGDVWAARWGCSTRP